MKRILLLATWFVSAVIAAAAQLDVFAAASLSDALQEIAPGFKAATGHTLRFNFGASGALLRQIKESAPADVFVSADESRVDQLESAGLLLPGSRRALLGNVVVVVGPSDGRLRDLGQLTSATVGRVAIGDPATVPVGTYTKAYLTKVGKWKPLLEKMVPLDNVRAVLAAVETGNADAGFVYRTDALISKRVRIAFEITGPDAPVVRYPLAIVKATSQAAAARQLSDYLAGPEAGAVFVKYGFSLVSEGVSR